MIIAVNGLYNRAFNQIYIQIEYLVILVIFLIIVFYLCAKGLRELRTIDIYTEKITFRYLGIRFGSVPLSKIIAYSTFIDDKTTFVKFTTNKRTYFINRNLLSNEVELITAFKSSKIKIDQKLNYTEYKKIKNRETVLWGSTGLTLLLISALHFAFHADSEVKRSELVPISVTLKDPFEIHKISKSPARFITFEIAQNNEFTFRIGLGYDKIDLKQLKQFMPNDTLRMLIEREDFESKIEKNKNPTFMKSHFRWTDINVYELYVNNKRILSAGDCLVESSENEKSNRLWTPIMVIAGLIILRQAKKAYR